MRPEESPLLASQIRQQVDEIITVHPITLEMTIAQRKEVEHAREDAVCRQFPDPAQQEYGLRLARANTSDELRRLREQELAEVPAEDLWIPVVEQNLLSGFVPLGEQPLCTGGTSEIWLCKSRFADETRLVLKLITTTNIKDVLKPVLALRELQTVFNRRHPNIVNYFDAGTIQRAGVRLPYIAMEHLSGTNLRQWRSCHDCSERDAALIAAVIGEALAFSHAGGITHGDLKPDNVMVTKEILSQEAIKLIDFGFGGDVGAALQGRSPGYSDPVIPFGEHAAQAQRDIYALGMTLYFCLTGTDPVQFKDEVQLRQELPELLQNIENRELRAIILKATAPDVRHRYRSVSTMVGDLNDWLDSYPVAGLGIRYTMMDRWRRLVIRCRTANREEDHTELLAWTLSVLALGIFLLLPVSLILPAPRPDIVGKQWPSVAIIGISFVYAVSVWILTLPPPPPDSTASHFLPKFWQRVKIDWMRRQSGRMAGYVLAYIATYLSLRWFIVRDDFAEAIPAQFLLEGFAFTYIGLGNPRWGSWTIFGAAMILLSFFHGLVSHAPDFP